MVKSRYDGIFSDGGLSGLGSPNSIPAKWSDASFIFQHQAYTDGLKFGVYTPHRSQIGGQGMVFSLLDISIPFSPQVKLKIFHALTALLSAVALTLIILWFHFEFGFWVAMLVLASAVLSQWLVVFGRLLYWSMWGFYLPMVAVMYFLRRVRRIATRHDTIAFASVIFISVFAKALLNGYEYITTALIMMMVPYVYYAILDRWSLRAALKGLLVAGSASCLAIFISFAILCFQIASVDGNMRAGVNHIVRTLKRTTYREPHSFGHEIGQSLTSNPNPNRVVLKYVVGEDTGAANGSFFDLNRYISVPSWRISEFVFKVRYLNLIILFFLMSVFLLWRNRYLTEGLRHSSMVLVLTTWFSMSAPLSWFYIFNQHAYNHTHMDFIVWQMPFTFFGFALCGLLVKNVFAASRSRTACQAAPGQS